MKNIIIILSLFLFISVQGKPKKTCDSRLSRLWARENLLSQCVLTNLIPTATYCIACLKEFNEVDILYKEFVDGTDSIDSKKCIDVYKADLHVINYIYNYSQLLWKELVCQECLVNENETKEFIKDCEEFNKCVDLNKNASCTKCIDVYNKVIGSFDKIKAENPKRICGVVLDNMQQIKTIWTKNLGCNKKQKSSLTVFLAVSSALMLLPGLFYGGLSFSYNKYLDTVNENQTGSEPVEDGNRNDQILPSNEPSSSSNNKKDGKEYDIDYMSESIESEDSILDINRSKQELLKLAQTLEMPTKKERNEGSSSDEDPIFQKAVAANTVDILLDI